MPKSLAVRQQQTRAARDALASQFPSPESKREHYRALGRRSAARRFVLSGDERDALVGAYEVLRHLAERAQIAERPQMEAARAA